MKRLLFAVSLAVLLASALPALAADPSQLNIASRYELLETGRMVRATHTLTPQVTGEFMISLPVHSVQAVKLTYQNSETPLDVTTTEAEAIQAPGGQTIRITTFTLTLPQKRNAVLSFETDSLAREYGKSLVFALPATAAAMANVQSVELIAPTARGLAVNYSGASPDTSIGSGRQSYRFLPAEGSAQQLLLLFGTAATANVKWDTRLANGSWWWQTMQFVLPPDTNQQTVFLKSLQPRPSQLRVDRDGNIIAEYRIGPKKSVNVTAEALVGLRSVSYNTTNTRTLADLPQQMSGYTTGRSESADSAVLVIVKQRFDAILAVLEELGGQAAVAQLRGDLQATGVPTREVRGIRFWSGGQIVEPHVLSQWLEVFVPGIGWMTLDPLAMSYGRSDFQHLGLSIVSPLSQPSFESSQRDLNVSFVDETLAATDYGQTTVHVTKYVLLPGLSLTRTQLQLPPGGVLDNATVAGADVDAYLGSLAPLQHVSRWSLSLAGAAWRTGEVQFGPGGSDGIGEVLATGSATLNYWGAVVEALVLAAVTTLVIKWRRSGRRVKARLAKTQTDEAAIAAEDLLKDNRPGDAAGS